MMIFDIFFLPLTEAPTYLKGTVSEFLFSAFLCVATVFFRPKAHTFKATVSYQLNCTYSSLKLVRHCKSNSTKHLQQKLMQSQRTEDFEILENSNLKAFLTRTIHLLFKDLYGFHDSILQVGKKEKKEILR